MRPLDRYLHGGTPLTFYDPDQDLMSYSDFDAPVMQGAYTLAQLNRVIEFQRTSSLEGAGQGCSQIIVMRPAGAI